MMREGRLPHKQPPSVLFSLATEVTNTSAGGRVSYTPDKLDCPLPPADLEGRSLSRITFDLTPTPQRAFHSKIVPPI